VNYTTSDGYLIIARYSVSSTSPDVADANSEQVILKDGPFPDHYGGELSFGPVDGYLYFGIGTGSGSSPDSLGQDLSVLRGKLLRIDVETGAPATYTIPPTNPYVSTANARPEIWATGLRNPWRSSFDRATGDYYIADVGQAAREEVDAIRKGAVEFDGRSTGWDVSFLKGEFSQGNDESMIVVRDVNSQNFYFFIGGKLWKWYKAFDAAVFPADNFAAFGSAVQRKFGDDKRDTLTPQCQRCEVKSLCNGGCPKDRFVLSSDGDPGQNYLCAGLELFFKHTRPAMQTMAQLLQRNRPPSDLMALTAAEDARGGPYAPCPCLSGKKFRFCHGDRAPQSPFSGIIPVTAAPPDGRAVPLHTELPLRVSPGGAHGATE